MCRLTLVNTGSGLVNRIVLPTMLQLSAQGNQDGTGFLVVDDDSTTLYKSKDAADELPDLGLDVLERVVSNRPVLAHVRAASKGIVVTKENAHPFQGERFTIAHNGRLYPKDEKVEWSNSAAGDTSLASDSLVFLNALEEFAKLNPDAPFLELITTTMSEFKGKFALLVYDSMEDKHYVIRGSTAELHMAPVVKYPMDGGDGEVLGFVVNTSKTVLADSLQVSMQVAQAVTGIRLGMGKIEELDKETVYEVTGTTLTKIGEIKETPVTYAYQNAIQRGVSNYVASKSEVDTKLPIWAMSQKISNFARKHYLGINDIDALFYIFIGIGIADASPSDLDIFCECVIPKISAGKKVLKRLANVLDKYSQIYINVYSSVPGLSYPWMVSTSDAINNMIKFYEKAKNKKEAAG